MSARQRLFVALALPAEARAALAAWSASAPGGVQRVPAQSLHLTMAFLGSRPPGDAAVAAAVLDRVARPVGEVRVDRVLWLPPRRPGVLGVGLVPTAALSALRADVVAGLEQELDWSAERRAFTPHVTVGRVRRGAALPPGRAGVPDLPALAFTPPALTLYRSHTDPGGARYEALARVQL